MSGLSKSFGDVHVLSDVSFEADDGSLLAVLGESGAGKTTILRCLAGLEVPDAGQISLGNRVVFDAAVGVNVPPERRGVGMVYQSYALWPHMTVAENIAYPLRVRKDPETETKVGEVIGLMKLKGLAERHPYELSGGEQQRVGIARALVYKPGVVLLDEPFSNLDVPLREALRDELRRLQQELRVTMVYVTHDRVDAFSLSDSMVVLSAGRVAGEGASSDLIHSPPNSYVASFVAGMLVIPGDVAAVDGAVATITTPFGTLSGRAGSVKLGPAKLCLPPSALTVAEEGAAGSLAGEVRGVVVRQDGGSSARVSVGASVVEVKAPSWPGGLRVGDRVSLQVDQANCIVLAE